ncbi:uncharacterized protein LOC115222874 isoform X3 [Octopus sinensis]|uniref:Uncharacterized protein LOC115222874 isoform X3 n=1 Tax=Octopus sinensis TaxID=2607531 RepID=A0A6P7TH28_9MOLL|nr:uncharacterized protein LOC115222874 isoform X3 [Octopus sinensis]
MGRRNLLNYIRFDNWNPEQVAAWLRGLDDVVLPYVQYFLNSGIDGKKLFMMSNFDLEKLNVTKIGHQELILESIGLLLTLRYGFESENLQSLALQLSVKARCLVAVLNKQLAEEATNKSHVSSNRRDSSKQTISVPILSAVCDIISSLKPIVTWLDRSPFEGMCDLQIFRKSIVKLGLQLLDISLPCKNKLQDYENTMLKSCASLATICDEIVTKSKDPLEFQPASLELATITKKPDEKTLGLHIVSYHGIHVIGDIKELSPAKLSGKIMKGDEVIQVNNQTVVGWQLRKLVSNVKEKPKEVVLLLKKRPHHTNPFGHIPNRRKISNKQQTSTLPKSLKKRRCRDEEKPSRASFQEYLSSNVTPDFDTNKDGNETDNEVFRSGSESPQYKVEVESKQRRATVSGGSPTHTRPPLVIEDLDQKESSPVVSPDDDTSEELKDSETTKEERRDTEGGTFVVKQVKADRINYRHSTSDLPPSTLYTKPKVFRAEIPSEDSCFISTTPTADKNQVTTITVESKKVPSSSSSDNSSSSSNNNSNSSITPESPNKVSDSSQVTARSCSTTSANSTNTYTVSVDATPAQPSVADQAYHKPLRQTKSHHTSETTYSSAYDYAVQRKFSCPVDPTSHEDFQLDSEAKELILRSANHTRHKRISSFPASQPAVPQSGPSPATDGLCKRNLPHTTTTTTITTAARQLVSHSADFDIAHSKGFGDSSVASFDTTTHHKWTPVENRSWSTSEISQAPNRELVVRAKSRTNSEVACDAKNTPTLTKITRLNSIGSKVDTSKEKIKCMTDEVFELERKKVEVQSRAQEHEDRAVRPAVKKVDFDVTAKEKVEEPTSYTCTVVGGVAQMIPMGKNTSESQVVRRRAKTSKRVAADRRISCKDLGRGDCEGWLYKKKQSAGPLGKNWKKRWCILKESNMFHYKRNDDLKAEGVIHLPAFKVSPAPEMKSKKFAFKVHNAGTTFYFASERQDDMSKWMNKMGLAAINYDMSNVSTTGGFIKPDKPVNTPHAVQTDVYYSESEDDNDDTSSHQELSEHSEGKDYDSSNDDLKELYRQLERRNLTIVGTDRNQRRRSHIQSADMKMTVSDEQIDRMKRICILKRSLKDKELELETLENILGSGTPHQLQEYKELYGSTQSLGRL